MNLNNVEFIKSAANPKDFLPPSLPMIVFSGKSNVGKSSVINRLLNRKNFDVGKSSVINRLLNRKNFARVGGQPGKTIHVNYFLIDQSAYFADLPGYGYAKVSKEERARWGQLMEAFFAAEERITLGVMIVDARHKPTADDCTMAAWFLETGRPLVLVANKCDKLKKSEMEPHLACIRETLSLPEHVPSILFSAEKGTGSKELTAEILHYIK